MDEDLAQGSIEYAEREFGIDDFKQEEWSTEDVGGSRTQRRLTAEERDEAAAISAPTMVLRREPNRGTYELGGLGVFVDLLPSDAVAHAVRRDYLIHGARPIRCDRQFTNARRIASWVLSALHSQGLGYACEERFDLLETEVDDEFIGFIDLDPGHVAYALVNTDLDYIGKRCASCVDAHSLLDRAARVRGTDVYFVQSESGPIKIGHSNNIDSRLATFQTGHHEELRLVAKIAGGGPDVESTLHRWFDAERIRGEWFAPCEQLLALIDSLNGRR